MRRPASRRWWDPATCPHHVEDRTGSTIEGPADFTQRFPTLPSFPHRGLVADAHPRSSHALHEPSDHSLRCTDALSPPRPSSRRRAREVRVHPRGEGAVPGARALFGAGRVAEAATTRGSPGRGQRARRLMSNSSSRSWRRTGEAGRPTAARACTRSCAREAPESAGSGSRG